MQIVDWKLDAGFQQVCLFKTSEIFKVMSWDSKN